MLPDAMSEAGVAVLETPRLELPADEVVDQAVIERVPQAVREAMLDACSAGTYSSRILSRAQAMLDLEETRLGQIDNPGGW